MSRKPRNQILFDGCFAHVFSKSCDKKHVFQTTSDFEFFKALLLKIKKEYGFLIHHYCLMNTHFHMAVSLPSLHRFSQALKKLKWHYSRYHNQNAKQEGTIWKERFKSLIIENERYLYACGLYIEANPVQAGMVGRPEDWPYSSARYYVQDKKDSLVDFYEQDDALGDVDLTAHGTFTKGRVIGSELFKIQVAEEAFTSFVCPLKK